MKYPKTTLTDREIYDNCPPSGGAPFELIHPRAFQDLRMCIDFGIRHMIEQGRLVVPKTGNEAAFDQLLRGPRELAQQDADAFGIGYVVDGQRVAPHRVQLFVPAAKATDTAGEPMTMSYVQNVPDHCDRITWRGAYYHLKEGAEAARQPVPVVAVKTWESRLAGNPDRIFSEVVRRAMEAEIADLRAALAARSQP